MSSNRLKYDSCAYASTMTENSSQLEYNLYKGKYEKCDTCFKCPSGDYTVNLPFVSRVEVENELFNINRPGTKCPNLKYDPKVAFNNPKFTPPTLCQGIYYLTPNNLEKPTTNMLNENNLGVNFCPK